MQFQSITLIFSFLLFNTILLQAQDKAIEGKTVEYPYSSAIDGGSGDYKKIDFAIAFLKALENGKPRIALEFTLDKSKRMLRKLEILSNDLQSVKIRDNRIPGVFFRFNELGNNFFERLYYDIDGFKRKYKLQIIIIFDSTPYNMDIIDIVINKGNKITPQSEDLKINRINMSNVKQYFGAVTNNIYDSQTNTIDKKIEFYFDMRRGFTFPNYLNRITLPIHIEIENASKRYLDSLLDYELPTLEKLKITESGLEFLSPEIKNFKNLKHLEIYADKLVYIPKEIGTLKRLEHLTIFSRDLVTVPEELGDLLNLKVLNINYKKYGKGHTWVSNNVLSTIPQSISNLQNLEEFRIKLSKIKEIPQQIGKLARLKILEIQGGSFKLPKEIGNLLQLKSLRLEGTITDIPEEIGNLKSLKSLYLQLGFQEQRTFPASIGNLTKLEDAFISTHEINSLPNEIGQWENLKKLELQCPYLKELPQTIGNLKQLRYLSINSKKLISLPETLNRAEALKTLKLQNIISLPELSNPIKIIDTLIIEDSQLDSLNRIHNFSNVVTIKINNSVVKDYSNSFRNLNRLEKLALEKCSLETIPAEVFLAKNLSVLNVAMNNIKEIPDEILNLQHLKEVKISSNKSLYPLVKEKKFPFKFIIDYYQSIF